MSGYIYVIQFGDLNVCKSGSAKNPKKRLGILQVGSPVTLSLIHTKRHDDYELVEIAVHKQLAGFRIQGEWFAVSPEAGRNVVDYAADCGLFLLPEPAFELEPKPSAKETALADILRYSRDKLRYNETLAGGADLKPPKNIQATPKAMAAIDYLVSV